jgi:hypothetical protein
VSVCFGGLFLFLLQVLCNFEEEVAGWEDWDFQMEYSEFTEALTRLAVTRVRSSSPPPPPLRTFRLRAHRPRLPRATTPFGHVAWASPALVLVHSRVCRTHMCTPPAQAKLEEDTFSTPINRLSKKRLSTFASEVGAVASRRPAPGPLNEAADVVQE